MTKKTKLNPGEKKLADQDYWSKLNDADKEWLNQFNEEYYQGIYNEKKREIHPEKFDRQLKDARNSRIKDVAYMNMIDDKFGNDSESFENVSNEDINQIYKESKIDRLCKINEKDALDLLRHEAIDMAINSIDSLENILSDLQRDSIKIFINARKNK